MMVFKELYAYREMVFSLVRRDLVGKYKRSILGFLWTFVDPLLQLIVYTFVFTVVFPNPGIDKFYLHLFVALIPWGFFQSCLVGGCTTIINQQDMVKKIYFPREVLPVSYVTSQFISMILSFIVVFAVLLLSGHGISLGAMIWLPIIMLAQYLVCLGVALVTSAITVYFRDIQQIMNVVSLALIYASPVVYSIDMIPENMRSGYMLNPMSAIIVAYRDVLYYKRTPELGTLKVTLGLSFVVCVIGFIVFRTLKRRFVEEL